MCLFSIFYQFTAPETDLWKFYVLVIMGFGVLSMHFFPPPFSLPAPKEKKDSAVGVYKNHKAEQQPPVSFCSALSQCLASQDAAEWNRQEGGCSSPHPWQLLLSFL